MKTDNLHFIMTGGTIDAVWDGIQDAIVIGSQSIIPAYFNKYKLFDKVTFTQVCMKDSRKLE